MSMKWKIWTKPVGIVSESKTKNQISTMQKNIQDQETIKISHRKVYNKFLFTLLWKKRSLGKINWFKTQKVKYLDLERMLIH